MLNCIGQQSGQNSKMLQNVNQNSKYLSGNRLKKKIINDYEIQPTKKLQRNGYGICRMKYRMSRTKHLIRYFKKSLNKLRMI